MADTQPQVPTHTPVGMWVGMAALAATMAVAGYIMAHRAPVQTLASMKNHQQVVLGEQTYMRACVSCHGIKMSGKPTWAPGVTSNKQAGTPLNADGLAWHLSDQHLFNAIATGIRVEGKNTRRIHDEGFAGKLSDKEIWALIAYFKTTWTARQVDSQKETTLRDHSTVGK